MKANVEIDINDIDFHAMSDDDVIKIIMNIDLQMQEGEFTLKLIENLVESLKVDYSNEELRLFLKELRKKLK